MSEATIRFGTASVRVIIHDENEHIQRHWARGSFYETGRNGLLTYIASRYPRGLTYVDVGASIGNHTLFFLYVLDAKLVISVEPCQESLSHFYDNISMNYPLRVEVQPYAASDRSRRLKLMRYDTPEHVNAGMVKIDADGLEKIRAKTLDEMIGGRDVHVIKIDVEHYNIPVLEGALETLARGPDVFIECENVHERDETDAFMREVGYARTPHVFNSTPTYQFIKT